MAGVKFVADIKCWKIGNEPPQSLLHVQLFILFVLYLTLKHGLYHKNLMVTIVPGKFYQVKLWHKAYQDCWKINLQWWPAHAQYMTFKLSYDLKMTSPHLAICVITLTVVSLVISFFSRSKKIGRQLGICDDSWLPIQLINWPLWIQTWWNYVLKIISLQSQ